MKQEKDEQPHCFSASVKNGLRKEKHWSESKMDDPVEAAKARSADFSTTKPLPPIGKSILFF